MGFWKNFNYWFESKVFPKTDTKEIKINRLLALWQIAAGLIFTFAGVMMGTGVSFMTLGASFQIDSLATDNSTQSNPILQDIGVKLVQQGSSYFNWGIVVVAFGLFITAYHIMRENTHDKL